MAIWGVIFILLRYLLLAVLRIKNEDFKVGVILLMFIALISIINYLSLRQTREAAEAAYIEFPIDQIEEKVVALNSVGMFMLSGEEPSEHLTERLLGQLLIKEHGWSSPNLLIDPGESSVSWVELMRLDSERVMKPYSAYVEEGHESLQWLFLELVRISQGRFTPRKIIEQQRNGHTNNFEFIFQDQLHQLKPNTTSNWQYLPEIIAYINKSVLMNVDYKYCYLGSIDPVILCLDSSERQELQDLTGLEIWTIGVP